nr:peroxisomal leader peptide-processing protease isoform X3 [Manis javanica]
MGRQWGPATRAAEQAGCVVSASRAGQPEAGPWSCSGVILSRSPGLVLCHGGIFTPFLRAGSSVLTAAGAAFLPGGSCGDDLRLRVQWGPTAVSPAGRAERGRRGLCSPQCAGLEPGPPSPARGRPLRPPRPAELLLLLSCPAFRAHFALLFGGEAAEQWRFASAVSDEEVSEDDEEDQLRALGWFALLRVQRGPEEAAEECGPAVAVAPLGAVPKGAPLLACGSPFGTFCPDIFLNTLSRGVLSNATGPLLLTDARCLPGTEGGGVFAARPAGALVALVAAPLCWKAREWGTHQIWKLPLLCVNRKPLCDLGSATIWGHVVFATQETSPYDIAVVSLEEDLGGVPTPVPAEHFHEGETVSVVGFGVFGQACGPSVTSGILSAVVQVDNTPVMLQTTCAVHGGSSGGPLFSTSSGDLLGIVASNTRDNNTGATYPHLNFSIPITVLQPALQRYSQTGDLGSLRELDQATEPVRVVWRLQRPLAEAPRSKL